MPSPKKCIQVKSLYAFGEYAEEPFGSYCFFAIFTLALISKSPLV